MADDRLQLIIILNIALGIKKIACHDGLTKSYMSISSKNVLSRLAKLKKDIFTILKLLDSWKIKKHHLESSQPVAHSNTEV